MTFSTSFEDKTRFRSAKNNTLLTKDGQALEWNEAHGIDYGNLTDQLQQ